MGSPFGVRLLFSVAFVAGEIDTLNFFEGWLPDAQMEFFGKHFWGSQIWVKGGVSKDAAKFESLK